ncbi:MAG TPA: hypothetical protein VJK66_02490 [Gaiellaceae bacterium]|nr:hypothetical protein [Gaiellaceae bacterium]
MPEARVLADRLGVVTDDGTVRYAKGDSVELSDDDFERHLASGAIASAEAPKKGRDRRKPAEAPTEEPATAPEAEPDAEPDE